MKIEKLHVYLGCLALILAGLWFFEGRWNEDKAIAEVAFIAMSNQERYLKKQLDFICQRYGFPQYPCPTQRMSPQDQVNYRQYEEWYKEQRKQIRGFFQK